MIATGAGVPMHFLAEPEGSTRTTAEQSGGPTFRHYDRRQLFFRWIMADLGRFAIHTSRKRMIELQRQLYGEGKPYRAFDVYNLGRYERQWWQAQALKGADDQHRQIVLAFYRAEPLTGASSPLLHGPGRVCPPGAFFLFLPMFTSPAAPCYTA